MENEEEKSSLEMGGVQLRHCAPGERGGGTWRVNACGEQGVAARLGVWRGGLRSRRLYSKWLRFQVSEPWGHLAQKMFLEPGTAEGGKNKEKLK